MWPGEKHKRRQGRVGEPSGVGSISAIENSATATKTRVQDQTRESHVSRASIILQWPKHTLFGMPIHQRADLDVDAPLGRYSPDRPVNIGKNGWDNPSQLRGHALSRLALRDQQAHPLSLGRHQPRASARRKRQDHPGRPSHPLQRDLLLRDPQECLRRRQRLLPEADHRRPRERHRPAQLPRAEVSTAGATSEYCWCDPAPAGL